MTYRTVTLVTRNAECGNMTSEEFVKNMFNDVLEAVDKYDDLYIPEYIASDIRNKDAYVASMVKQAVRFAEKKWKTEKKRNEYVNAKCIEARKKVTSNGPGFYYGITYFDFDCNPGSNSLSGNCCISLRTLTPEALVRCFNEIKDNKYFKVAHGWKLEYEASEGSYRSSFRPQIKLIVDKEIEEEMKAEVKKLADDIAEFYRDCGNWTGD